MKIACSLSIRGKEHFEEAIMEASKKGFSYIDLLVIGKWFHINPLDLHLKYDENIKLFDSLFSKYNVSPININFGTNALLHDRSDEAQKSRENEWKAIVKLMKHYNITTAAVQPLQKDQNRPWQEAFDDCIKTLSEQITFGKSENITFALEPHVNGPIETLEEAKLACEALPEMKLTLDPTHFLLRGDKIEDCEWMIEKAAHIHLRDTAKDQLQTAYKAGDLNLEWFIKKLKEYNYDNNISIEYLSLPNIDYDPAVEAKKMKDDLEKLI